jgi:peptidoglycan/xylan/chitin deacetylase (PgdA/CDA1 family)
MDIIVSHDIDHWRWREHYVRDLYAPKYAVRALRARLRGDISTPVLRARLRSMVREYQHSLDALVAFNHRNDVPATFFVATERGRSLAYGPKVAAEIVAWLRAHGCDRIGVHGIVCDDPARILAERERMRSILGHDDFGVRMHYLRLAPTTLGLLAQAGYRFSSNSEGIEPPFNVGPMVEFPIGVMDVRALPSDTSDDRTALTRTLELVERADHSGSPVFTVNFHDPLFSNAFPAHRRWYMNLIGELKTAGYAFTTFADYLRSSPPPPGRTMRE